MNYGEVLEKAWKTIWKHKILWLFGFFASCTRSGSSGGSGGGSGGSSNYDYDGHRSGMWDSSPGVMRDIDRFFYDIGNTIQNTDVWVWIVVGLVFFLLIILLALIQYSIGTFGRIGLVHGAWQVDEGAERLDFMGILRACLPYFWRVFLLYLIISIVIFILVIVLAMLMVLVSVVTLGIGLLLVIPMVIMLICLALPISWFIGILLDLTVVAIVGENLGLIEAIKRAWGIVMAEPVHALVMGLILGVGNFIIGLIMSIPFVIAFLPILIGLVAGGFTGDWETSLGASAIFSVACCCLYLPVYLVLVSMLEAYIKSAWTLTFRRLSGQGV